MLPVELEQLVRDIVRQRCERQNIELKRAAKGTPERLYDTLSSFSNQTGGGIILFGIDEKNDFALTGVYDAQDLQTQITNQALQMQPVVRPLFTVAEIDGKTIVSAEISECDLFEKPCFYQGAGRMRGAYVRVGDADLPMTEYEIYSYEVFKRKIQDELRVVERADSEDFNSDTLDEYFIHVKKKKPNLASQPKEKILKLQGLLDNQKPTVAGMMLLGEYPQAYFPQLSIIAMVVDGTEIGQLGEQGERFIDDQRIEGSIPQMLESAVAFVRRNSRNATIIDETGKRVDRTEYPMMAVREIILNALVHRDYSIHTENSPIRVILYQDRLEVENPGGLYGRITLDDLGKMAADTRNPFLAGGLEVLLGTENRFSGIPTVMQEMKKAGLPPAVFTNRRGTFKVTLYNQQKQAEDAAMAVAEAETPYLVAKLPASTRKILAYCQQPRSRSEIAAHLQQENPYYVARRYIKPLVEQGMLELTMPESPRSKNQRYVVARQYMETVQ